MEDIQYIGEHLMPRMLGEIVTIVSFAAILFAAIAYGVAMRSVNKDQFIRAGRRFFTLHGIAVLSLIGLMFFVMLKRYYEYTYAFEHVSDDLPFIYTFSAFWEGQQGSFLLWMFWHFILGLVLIRKAKVWEPGVLMTLCVIQTWLASMLLGIYIPFTDFKLGDNPMLLLREVVDAPIFASEDYLELIEGKGLNLLLQNYWNVIHPPITFLGFASVAVPFAYAVTGLLTGQYKSWFRPALPWVLFSVGILGVGILMGSAWAYEALTFGGYWAWDPVENMSLVPWIMLLAGLHAHLVTQVTGHSRRSVYLFYILAFCLSIYSTYLVRSGALEDTSVHAFTEMGMGPQLTAFLLFFILGSAYLLIRHWKRIPAPATEESAYSKEFWMFIGLMILAISSILITYSTSLPVINKIVQVFNPDYEGRVIQDANAHYNKYQLWIAVFIAVLSGQAQWFRYRAKALPAKPVVLRILTHLLITLLGTLALTAILDNPSIPIIILVAASFYGITSNIDYLFAELKGKRKLTGSVISHAGFGIMLLGIILSGINKRHISQNPQLMAGIINTDDEELLLRNVVLLKNEPIFSQGFLLEYERDSFIGTERQYFVSFKELDEEGEPVDSFMVNPNVIYTEAFDNIEVYHPSIRRTVAKDYFTRIATLPKAEVDPSYAQALEDTLRYDSYTAHIGDTINLENNLVVIGQPVLQPEDLDLPVKDLDKTIGVPLQVINKKEGQITDIMPRAILRGHLSYVLPEKYDAEELRFKLSDTILLPFLPMPDFKADKIVKLKPGQTFDYAGHTYKFEAFDKNPDHPYYFSAEGDISVGARILRISSTSPAIHGPVYVIRGNEVRNIDGYEFDSGVAFRFKAIDPATEEMTLGMKQFEPEIRLEIAKNVSRTDFIVLEALAFPGINLFWIGSILMLGGVFYSWWQRRKQQRSGTV